MLTESDSKISKPEVMAARLQYLAIRFAVLDSALDGQGDRLDRALKRLVRALQLVGRERRKAYPFISKEVKTM